MADGLILVNCMEKLTMNAPRETLRVRLEAALDAGVDGVTRWRPGCTSARLR